MSSASEHHWFCFGSSLCLPIIYDDQQSLVSFFLDLFITGFDFFFSICAGNLDLDAVYVKSFPKTSDWCYGIILCFMSLTSSASSCLSIRGIVVFWFFHMHSKISCFPMVNIQFQSIFVRSHQALSFLNVQFFALQFPVYLGSYFSCPIVQLQLNYGIRLCCASATSYCGDVNLVASLVAGLFFLVFCFSLPADWEPSWLCSRNIPKWFTIAFFCTATKVTLSAAAVVSNDIVQ